MAERELRRMSRTELIEIIYAMKTREEQLLQENAELKEKVSQEVRPIAEASSLAEATAELNRVLAGVQEATRAYREYVKRQESSLF